MLTRYQNDVLTYFREYAQAFLQHLADDTQQAIIVVDDMLPRLVQFLDRTIRLEIGLYERGSVGYHRLIDMLIEVHVTENGGELHKELAAVVNEIFRPDIYDG